MTDNGMVNGYNIRTEEGMTAMLEALADGYPGYDGTPFRVSMFDERNWTIGLYVIDRHEIQFWSLPMVFDLTLISTSIHELAHHIDTCLNNGKCSFHSRKFYKILFNLFARAEELGFAVYDDIANRKSHIRKYREFGRPYDVQIMEHYYGRPDGRPVDEELLKKELEYRRSKRKSRAEQEAEAKERERQRREKELETKRRIAENNEKVEMFLRLTGLSENW